MSASKSVSPVKAEITLEYALQLSQYNTIELCNALILCKDEGEIHRTALHWALRKNWDTPASLIGNSSLYNRDEEEFSILDTFARYNTRKDAAFFNTIKTLTLDLLNAQSPTDKISAYHHAAFAGNLAVLTALRKAKANPSLQTTTGTTPLMIAVERDKGEATVTEMLKALQGQNLDAQNAKGQTALHLAIQFGQTQHIHSLIKAGANPSIPDKEGRTALHYFVMHYGKSTVLSKMRNKVIERLFSSMHTLDVNAQDNEGRTALALAAMYYRTPEMLNLLTDYGATASIADNDHKTPVMHSIDKGFGTLSRYLTKRPSVLYAPGGPSKEKPIHLAARADNSAALQKLISEATLKKDTSLLHKTMADARTPILCALEAGKLDNALMIAQAEHGTLWDRMATGATAFHLGANIDGGTAALYKKLFNLNPSKIPDSYKIPDLSGWTPLHYAASSGCLTNIKFIIKEIGATAAQAQLTNQGENAAHIAAQAGNLDVLEYLKTTFPTMTADAHKRTCLHHAAANGHLDMVKMLVQPLYMMDITAQDNNGYTPLHCIATGAAHYATKNPDTPRDDILSDYKKIIKMLVKAAPDNTYLAVRDNEGATALHLACQHYQFNIAHQLFTGEPSAQVDAIDNKGRTPLDYLYLQKPSRQSPHYKAMCEDREDLTIHLLGKQARFTVDKQGQNVFHRLARHGWATEIGVLSKILTDQKLTKHTEELLAQCDSQGNTPLHIACIKGKLKTADALIKQGADVYQANAKTGQTPLHMAFDYNDAKLAVVLLAQSKNPLLDIVQSFATYSKGNTDKVKVREILQQILKAYPTTALDATDEQGCTALHYAITHKWHDIAELLLNAGAKLPETDVKMPSLTGRDIIAMAKNTDAFLKTISAPADPSEPNAAYFGLTGEKKGEKPIAKTTISAINLPRLEKQIKNLTGEEAINAQTALLTALNPSGMLKTYAPEVHQQVKAMYDHIAPEGSKFTDKYAPKTHQGQTSNYSKMPSNSASTASPGGSL